MILGGRATDTLERLLLYVKGRKVAVKGRKVATKAEKVEKVEKKKKAKVAYRFTETEKWITVAVTEGVLPGSESSDGRSVLLLPKYNPPMREFLAPHFGVLHTCMQ